MPAEPKQYRKIFFDTSAKNSTAPQRESNLVYFLRAHEELEVIITPAGITDTSRSSVDNLNIAEHVAKIEEYISLLERVISDVPIFARGFPGVPGMITTMRSSLNSSDHPSITSNWATDQVNDVVIKIAVGLWRLHHRRSEEARQPVSNQAPPREQQESNDILGYLRRVGRWAMDRAQEVADSVEAAVDTASDLIEDAVDSVFQYYGIDSSQNSPQNTDSPHPISYSEISGLMSPPARHSTISPLSIRLKVAREAGQKCIFVKVRGDELSWSAEAPVGESKGTRSSGFIYAPVVDSNCEHFQPQRKSGPPMATAESHFVYNAEKPLNTVGNDNEWEFGNPPISQQDDFSQSLRLHPKTPSGFPSYNRLVVPIFNALELTSVYEGSPLLPKSTVYSGIIHNTPPTSQSVGLSAERFTTLLSQFSGRQRWNKSSRIHHEVASRDIFNSQGENSLLNLDASDFPSYFGLPLLSLNQANAESAVDARANDIGQQARRFGGNQPETANTCSNLAHTLRHNLAEAATQRRVAEANRSSYDTEEKLVQHFLAGISGATRQAEVLFYEVERVAEVSNDYRPGEWNEGPQSLSPRFGGYPMFYSNSHSKTSFEFCDRFMPYGVPAGYNIYAHTLSDEVNYIVTAIADEDELNALELITNNHDYLALRERYYLVTYDYPLKRLLRLPYIHTVLEN